MRYALSNDLAQSGHLRDCSTEKKSECSVGHDSRMTGQTRPQENTLETKLVRAHGYDGFVEERLQTDRAMLFLLKFIITMVFAELYLLDSKFRLCILVGC